MASILRYAVIIGAMAYLSPVHERTPELPKLPAGINLDSALKTLETAKSAGQAFAALDPETRTRLLAHVAAAAGTSETASAVKKPNKP
ncbi:MAG: hypothetical protein ACRDBH_03440 [Bosea sp. (in: a-proteobacteria)]